MDRKKPLTCSDTDDEDEGQNFEECIEKPIQFYKRTRKSGFVLAISEEKIKMLVDLIYKEIYSSSKSIIHPNTIFEHYISNIQLYVKKLIQRLNIEDIMHNRTRVRRILEVILFAILKSQNYQELVNDLMDFTGLTKAPIQANIKLYLNILKNKTGINIDKWTPKITYGVIKYTDDDVEWWIKLYEEMGSYNHVKDHIRKINGDGPSDTTIKNRIQELFIRKGRNFEEWEARFKRNIRLQKYGETEEVYWMTLYERFGSFYQVSLFLLEEYGKIIRSSAIKDRIKRKFQRKLRTDFENWVIKYKRENPTTFKSIYPSSDVLLWMRLFEEYGFISKVVEEYRKKTGNEVSKTAIVYRIAKFFEEEGKDFDIWYEKYRQSTEYGKKRYNNEEIEEWESLFEELGSFTGVSYYSIEVLGKDAPSGKTIKKLLKKKFIQEGRDFIRWVIEFYSPNHERSNNIGFYIHYIMEYLFLLHYLREGKKVFVEISPSLDRDTRIDNALIELDKNIKMRCIDYSSSRHKFNLFDKFYKNYQDIERELIIVSLLIDEDIQLPQNLTKGLKRNVKILNSDKFAKWVGYTKEELQQYNRAIELAKIGFYDDDAYNELSRIGKEIQQKIYELSKKYPISEKDLLKFLKSGTSKDYTYILRGLKFKDITDF